MRKLILLLLMGMFLINLVNAEITWDTVKQRSCIDLDQSCPTCTYVNITLIQYPNGTSTFPNYEMTQSGNKFYYQFCDTVLLGNYHVTLQGNKDGETQTEEGYFEVTKLGEQLLTTSQSILYIIFLIGIIGAMGLTVYFAVIIPWKHTRDEEGRILQISDLRWLKVLFGVMSYLLLMWTFGILRSVSDNYLSLAGTERIFNYLYWMMFSFVFPLVVLSFVAIVVSVAESKKIKKMQMRNLLPR